ncbi:hypothetical protein HOI18_04805 [Candidatus Uhrbacteria bacterium]|nr:hypothetical protein [Candidatus Uhrbacteria bacterium]
MVFYTLAVGLLAVPSVANAQTVGSPATIGYNGRLFNASGSALTGTYYIWFDLEPALTGGTNLGSNIQAFADADGDGVVDAGETAITVTNGFFTVEIPVGSDLADFVNNVWLEIKVHTADVVGSAETLSPRVKITKTPYSVFTQGIQNSSADPSVTFAGEVYYDTDTNDIKYYNGTSFLQLASDLDTAYNNFGSSAQIITVDDATTGLSFDVSAAGNLDFDLQSTGDLTIQDSGTAWATFGIDGSDNSFITIDTTDAISLDADAASNFNTSAGDLTFDAEAGSVNIDGGEAAANAVRITASDSGSGGIDIDSGDGGIAIDSTGAVSINAASASDFTTDAGILTVSGGSGVVVQGNASEIDVTTTGALDMNSGAGTWDASSTVSIDAAGISNLSTSVGTLTLATTAGGTASSVIIQSVDTSEDAIFLDADGGEGAGITLDAYDSSNNTTGEIAMIAASVDIDSSGSTGIDIAAGSTGSINMATNNATIAITGGGSSGSVTLASTLSDVILNTAAAGQNIDIGTTNTITRNINVATGTGADILTIGAGPDQINFASSENTNDSMDIVFDSITTANGIEYSIDALTTGNALSMTNTSTFSGNLYNTGTTGAWTGNVWNYDDTGNAAWTGNVLQVATGTGDHTGDIMNVSLEATTASDGQVFVIANADTSDNAGWLMDLDTSAAWTGIAMDIDFGAGVSTGNFLDVTYATAAHTGNAVDLNMGTNVAGDAINIATAGTSGQALDIAATGIMTADLISITSSGATVTDGADGLSMTFATGDGTNPTNNMFRGSLTSGGTAAGDIANGLYLDLASTAGGTDTAIFIDNTAAWDADISFQSDTTITNTSTNDLDFTDNSVSLNMDFGEATASTISLSTASDLDLVSSASGVDAIGINSTGGIDIDSGEAISIDTTADQITIATDAAATVFSGSADGTANVTLTAGDLDVSDGDLDVAGGDFNVVLDAADSASISNAAASAATSALVVANTTAASDTAGSGGLAVAHTITNYADDGAADTHVGLDLLVTSNTSDAGTDDIVYGMRVQDLGGAADGGNEYAIYQAGTSWDLGLMVEGAVDIDGAANIADTTAGADVAMGNASGNLTFLSDNADFGLTDATDNVFQLVNATNARTYLDVDAGAADTVTLGNATDVTAIVGSATSSITLTSAFTVAATTGLTTITGAADGTDALVLTAGDLLVTDGDVDISGGDFNVTLDAGDGVNIAKGAAPTADMFTIDNSSADSATDGVDLLVLDMDVADNTSGDVIHIIPSFVDDDADTNGNDTWNVINIDAFTATLAADGGATLTNTLNGLNIGNLTESVGGDETITSTALNIGTGWDTAISLGSGGLQLDDDVELSLGTSSDVGMLWETADADAHYLNTYLGASRNYIISEDANTDWTHATSTNPTLWIQSSDAGTVADYVSVAHDQTDGALAVGAGDLNVTIAGLNFNPGTAGDHIIGDTDAEWDGLYVGDDGVGLTLGADQDGKITYDATAVAIEIESALVAIGADPGGATATAAGDLIVSDALEVDGATDLDGTLNVAGVTTLPGAADGTDSLIMTAGDILLSDGDFDLSGGDFNVTLDAADGASVTSNGAASADAFTVALAGQTDADRNAFAVTATADDETNRTVNGISTVMTSAGTAAGDLARGLYLDLASTAGGTDTAIFIDNTAAWDVDISLQNDEGIHNNTNDTITFEDDDGTDYATLTATTLTGGAALTLSTTGATNLGLDTGGASDINIGSADITQINMVTDAASATDVNITGGVTISTTLAVTGVTTLSEDLIIDDATAGVDITMGSDNAVAMDIAPDVFASGTIAQIQYDTAEVPTGNITGFMIDLDTNLSAHDASNEATAPVALDIDMPDITESADNDDNDTISAVTVDSGAYVLNDTGSILKYAGIASTTPNITETAGTLTASAFTAQPGSITTGGTQNMYMVDAGTLSAGTLNGVNLQLASAGAAVETALLIGDNWDDAINVNSGAFVVETTGATILTRQATGTSPITVTGLANSTVPEIDINTMLNQGTIVDIDFSAAETLAGDLVGVSLNLDTNVTTVDDHNINGFEVVLPTLAATDALTTTNYAGFSVNPSGAISTAAGGANATVVNWVGGNVFMPTITSETGDTVSSYGLKVTGATTTNGNGTESAYGLHISGITSGVSDIPVFLAPVEATSFATEGGIYGDTTDGILYYRSSSAFAAMNADTDYSELIYPVDYDFADGEKSENSAVLFYSGDLDGGDIIGVDPSNGNFRKAQSGDVLAGVESGDRGNYLLRDGVPEREVRGLRQVGLLGNVLVKVTGDVSVGDALTLSSTSGVAMKATSDDEGTVGYARESHSGDAVSQIELLLMPQRGSVESGAEVLSASTSEASVSVASADFSGSVTVAEHLYGSRDMAGRARLMGGAGSVHVAFENEYAHLPIVTFSVRSENHIPGRLWVSDESTTGFTINHSAGSTTSDEIELNWIAIGVEDAYVSVSDGSSEEIEVTVTSDVAAEAAAALISEAVEETPSEEVEEEVSEEVVAEEVVEEAVEEEAATEEVVVEEEAAAEEVTEEVVSEEVVEEVVAEEVVEETVSEEVEAEEVVEEVVAEEAAVEETPSVEAEAEEAAE